MGVLFLPLLLGLGYVYPWRPDFIGGSLFARLTPIKVWWFDVPLFVGRAAVYFVLWSALAFLMNLGRRAPDVPANAEPPRLFRVLSAPGLAVYGLTITFASLDWSMSLNPLWFSTIYGAMYAVGQLLAGFAFAVLVATLLAEDPPTQLLRDLGNLLLAFTMIWAYLSFSQFLLIWAGNLPDETTYYVAAPVRPVGLGRPGVGPGPVRPAVFDVAVEARQDPQTDGGDGRGDLAIHALHRSDVAHLPVVGRQRLGPDRRGAGRVDRPGRRLAEPFPVASATAALPDGGRDAPGGCHL